VVRYQEVVLKPVPIAVIAQDFLVCLHPSLSLTHAGKSSRNRLDSLGGESRVAGVKVLVVGTLKNIKKFDPERRFYPVTTWFGATGFRCPVAIILPGAEGLADWPEIRAGLLRSEAKFVAPTSTATPASPPPAEPTTP
jgi:hypothetical protein